MAGVAYMARRRKRYHKKTIELQGQLVTVTDNLKATKAAMRFIKGGGKRCVSIDGQYTLGLKHRDGSAGAQTIVRLVGGDKLRGGLKSKTIMYSYEQRCAISISLLEK